MLRRAMDFRRLQIILAITVALKLAVTLSLALAGWGAYAIVLGSSVATALPFAVDLLIVRGWRPSGDQWLRVNWRAYTPVLRFGLQQAGSGMLRSAQAAMASMVLPGALGFAAMGLLDRAQALYQSTVGRVGNIVVETVYPVLPRYAADPVRYPRQATFFCQAILLVVVPGAVYLGLEGQALLRLLYGEKWIAAEPLIWPGTLIALGAAIFGIGWTVLLATNRLQIGRAHV